MATTDRTAKIERPARAFTLSGLLSLGEGEAELGTPNPVGKAAFDLRLRLIGALLVRCEGTDAAALPGAWVRELAKCGLTADDAINAARLHEEAEEHDLNYGSDYDAGSGKADQ